MVVICATTLAIPISPFLKENEIKYIVETVNGAL
jgi:dTDP-4-amino-4,6-dideoxygalactose transaminase